MRNLYIDMAERALWTAVQAFIAVWIIGDPSSAKSAAIAGVAAALSVVKGFAASRIGDKESAATLR
jgi:hypothetical protein